jgi:hypothetical protein
MTTEPETNANFRQELQRLIELHGIQQDLEVSSTLLADYLCSHVQDLCCLLLSQRADEAQQQRVQEMLSRRKAPG